VRARRVAAIAAVAALVLWLVKALAIWNAGGLDKSSLESPLFVAGLVALIVASAAFGAAVTEGRPLAIRAAAAAAGVIVGAALTILIQNMIVKPLLPESTGWVEEEAGLWVSAALVAAVVLWWNARRGPGVTAPT
jgi:mannitol-specific phosphotransferase system IIBC component